MAYEKFLHVKHGGNVPLSWIDFSISVNPFFPKFFDNYEIELNTLSSRYIYFEDIEESISKKISHDINLCAGTTESLYLLNMAFNNDVVIEKGSYGEYERVAKLFNKNVHIVDSVMNHEYNNCIVILNNPKNPNGDFLNYNTIKNFVESNLSKNNIPVLDDAFLDFILFDSNDWEKKWTFEGAIHLRTYTKSYSLPGIRVGYFIDPYDKMKKFKMPWSIGSIGKLFLIKMLKDDGEFLKYSMNLLDIERRRINAILDTDNKSPFFFCRVNNKKELIEVLNNNKMMVRDCSSFGYDSFIRFGIRKHFENNKLIDILKNYI
ncbi:aminotransferase class I/II-fold pyridoxal phosphate-dependent enzyme [Oceanotoga sp. DSM 15011]|nr:MULTISPECIES: aminotransferase class I/II-fold pyridoxal phosphate-dependent enzyme [Oceanotoga]UYP00155.1 aminotransferase class I/II-fold pyridoxal phosphate-dependent enzyme [Oceanotoga sp. DSM 15011]